MYEQAVFQCPFKVASQHDDDCLLNEHSVASQDNLIQLSVTS